MPSKPFYITTTLPYVNADPHIGHALEFIRADVIARWKKIQGYEVFFNTGTDEHGLKIFTKAQSLGIDPQKYVDQAAAKFREIMPALGISEDANFIRTTDPHHVKAAQEFWKLVDKKGYIYKKHYSVKYCVGCELEKTDSELVDGKCPQHPLQELELIQEENYFFKFTAFRQGLLDLYKKGGAVINGKRQAFVIPESRQKEIAAFVERGLEDFSISRLKEKMPWGIAVPGDEKQVMYVWFDALVNYVSAIGWPDDEVAGKKITGSFDKWAKETGGMVQYCGKDNLRQQTAMWQAMLLSAGLPNSKTVIIDGFVTGGGGIKMSKSLGNVVDPVPLIAEYGTEAMRYYCLREVHPFEDTPSTVDMFKNAYNANLANGLGNLVSRVMKMSSTNNISLSEADYSKAPSLPTEYEEGLNEYNLKKSMDCIWNIIGESDKYIQSTQPFKMLKSEDSATKKAGEEVIKKLLIDLYRIGTALIPFMPKTASTILECVKANTIPKESLFMRK
jgi:methionyl-tRNA synthetase